MNGNNKIKQITTICVKTRKRNVTKGTREEVDSRNVNGYGSHCTGRRERK